MFGKYTMQQHGPLSVLISSGIPIENILSNFSIIVFAEIEVVISTIGNLE
jgi:hypothetical protein